MKLTLLVSVVCTAALLLGQGSVTSADSSKRQLQDVLERQRAAWNRGDLDGFMQTYTKSPELTFFSGDTVERGWNATLARYRKKYGSSGTGMGQLSFTESQVQLFGPRAAMVTARWHLLMPNGEKREGLTTVICKHGPGGWKIVHDHSS